VLIEFALLFPLLASLIFAGVTAAMGYNTQLSVSHAAREGARYAATLPGAQCTPTTSCSGLNWAQLVQRVVVQRSGGTLTTAQVCVSLVTGNYPAVVSGTGYTTNADGTPCLTDSSADSGRRVQVRVVRPGDSIDGIFFRVPITQRANSTVRFES
jgi:Flp pilus assembly protein TadG